MPRQVPRWMRPKDLPEVAFYVDYAWTGTESGTAAAPWKHRSSIDWPAITTALASNPVRLYFSSRATWNNDQELTVGATGSAGKWLILDGHSLRNTQTSGTGTWIAETLDANRATFTNAGGTGGTVYVNNSTAFVTVKGFQFTAPTWGGVIIGTANPTTNIHDIVVENNVIDTPVNNHGVWFGYAETGCYNITVRNNTISNTPLEAIYMGHYSYTSPTITGVVVEYNTITNSGTTGEGDIDIKAGVSGAIVRYNMSHSVSTGGVLAGIAIAGPGARVYGNELYSLLARSQGGSGIEINADGDGAGNGVSITDTLVYNNLIYSNVSSGIAVFATASGATVSGLKILNNTFVGNGLHGLKLTASGGRTITVQELHNNIFSGNSPSQVYTGSSGETITAANNNLYSGSGTLLVYQGVNKTFGQWQALGFDANGVNAAPDLSASYVPNVGSPAIGAGSVQTEFTIDKAGTTRGASWDIGAYEAP